MKVFIPMLLLVALVNFLFAQDISADLKLIHNHGVQAKSFGVEKQKKKKSLTFLYKSTLGFYQSQISPQWGANCAFELTCSRFSGAMVKEYGLAKGFFLTLDRLGRCNKISMLETLPTRINT